MALGTFKASWTSREGLAPTRQGECADERRSLRQDCGQAMLTYLSRLRVACLAFLGCGAPARIPWGGWSGGIRGGAPDPSSGLGGLGRSPSTSSGLRSFRAYRPVGLHEAGAQGILGAYRSSAWAYRRVRLHEAAAYMMLVRCAPIAPLGILGLPRPRRSSEPACGEGGGLHEAGPLRANRRLGATGRCPT